MITDKIEKNKFLLIAGPCAIEGRDIAFGIAERLVDITSKLSIPLVYKGSYRKANRTRLDSFTGIGDIEALKILADIGSRFDVPVITDIHSSSEAKMAAEYVDIIQIPAFLARQTDILVSAASTGKIINIKKGQFMSADSMKYAVDKVVESGNQKVMITERGTQFGYNDLIVDFRGINELKKMAPTILDVTHSVQKPGQHVGSTGGESAFTRSLVLAAVGAGCGGLFLEVHPNPANAPSDGMSMMPLNELRSLLEKVLELRDVLQ